MDFSVHISFVKPFTQWGPLREVQLDPDTKRKVKLEEKSSASSDSTSHSLLGFTFWILLPWSRKTRCDQSRQKRRPRTVSPQLPLLGSFQHLLKCSGWFLWAHPSLTKLFQSSFCLLTSCLKGTVWLLPTAISLAVWLQAYGHCASTANSWPACCCCVFPTSQSSCPYHVCHTSRKQCETPASEMECTLSTFIGFPFPIQYIFCLWRKKFVYKVTASLCSRSIMTKSPRIMDINYCCLCYVFSLKRRGMRDFLMLTFF